MRSLVLPLLLLLAGCSSGGWSLSQGGMTDSTRAFASDQATSYSCERYDAATGLLTDRVTITRNVTPDQQAVAALGAVAGDALALLKAGKAAAMMGARGQGEAPPSAAAPQVACLGEHAPAVPVQLPPNPYPPSPTPSAFDPGPHAGSDGRVRELEAVAETPVGKEVWFREGGKPKSVPVAMWLKLEGSR
jgi:hypothetical protein